jgi:hypothetical protein
MDLSSAMALVQGAYIHHISKKNADGTPMRARVTLIKKWKTRPGSIEIHYKHGMYDFGTITETELSDYGIGYGS